jgi:hypothetical protein
VKSPWNIYPNLWQNSDFLTTQSLNHVMDCNYNNWQYIFYNSPLKNFYGIHSIKYNLNQLSLGKIIIEEIKCTFPNGQNFIYNQNWKKFNGQNYINDNDDNVYFLECNLENYNNLFQNKSFIELGLVIEQNSFQQDNFFSIITETRDINDINDINIVAVRMPLVTLVPYDLVKNNNNYLPLFKINTVNNIYTLMDYQYPIIFIKNDYLLGQKLEKFLDELYTNIIYINKENFNDNHKILTPAMAYVFQLKSLLKNDNLTVDYWFQQSLFLMGQWESFLDFNCKIYYLFHKDLLMTFSSVTERINQMLDKFYKMGSIGSFQWDGNAFWMDIDFNWSDNIIYLDFSASYRKDDLVNWIETSIISDESSLEDNKINKTRGFERNLMDFKINNETQITWIRYSIKNTIKIPHKLIIFNPIDINNLQINLIKKN